MLDRDTWNEKNFDTFFVDVNLFTNNPRNISENVTSFQRNLNGSMAIESPRFHLFRFSFATQ